jgi:D-serine deaminase-like pyridoxal phosphate-dependent protein
MSYAPKVGKSLDLLDPPSMIVDLGLLEANIKNLMDRSLPTGGVNIRPPLKTTKSALLDLSR